MLLGVLYILSPVDGWADDRLIVVSACAWTIVAAWHAIRLDHRKRPRSPS